MTEDERDAMISMFQGLIQELENDSVENILFCQTYPAKPVYKSGSPDPVDFTRKGCQKITTLTVINRPSTR